MSKYVLTYFDLRGRAEIVRFMFAAAGVKYEDKRVQEFTEKDYNKIIKMKPEDWKHSEEWLALKPNTPFNQLPTLEVDGVTIAQNKTIQALLGKRFGLAGKTDLDEAKTSMIAEATHDAFAVPIENIFMEKDPDKKAAATKKYLEETLPRYLGNFEKLAGDKGYFVADQLSYADIAFHENLTLGFTFGFLKDKDILDKYPKLKAIRENVPKNTGIAKWIKERPENPW